MAETSNANSPLPKPKKSVVRLSVEIAIGLLIGVLIVVTISRNTAAKIVSYPMLLSQYRVADVEISEDTAPFPATPFITGAAASDLSNRFITNNVMFGDEGETLKTLCSVAHPTAHCSPGELESPVSEIVARAAAGEEQIPVRYRLRFTGGLSGKAYSALVTVSFGRVK